MRKVFYGISNTGLSGAEPFSERGFLPEPPGHTVTHWWDCMTAAFTLNSNLLVGSGIRSVASPPPSGVAIWRVIDGSLSLSDPGVMAPTIWFEDKGWLGVGRLPGSATVERVYLAFTNGNHAPCYPQPPGTCPPEPGKPPYPGAMMWRTSTDSTGSTWPANATRIDPGDVDENSLDREGYGIAPLVLPSGRLFIAYARDTIGAFPGEGRVETCFNDTPHENDVADWGAEHLMAAWGPTQEPIHGIYWNNDPNWIDSIPGSMSVPNYPSVAFDPNNPNVVYVIFIGSPLAHPHSQAGPAPWGADRNVDLYIARSSDGGETFPIADILRITDAMLVNDQGSTDVETDQCKPTLAVDQFGGLNFSYVRIIPNTLQGGEPLVDIRYARIAQFSASITSIQTHALTNPFRPIPLGSARLGEYMGLTTSGCFVYASYPEVDPVNNRCNVMVTRISLCDADSDDNGLVQQEDIPAYSQQFIASDPRADLTHDQQVNASDLQHFLNAYTCNCGPQP